MIPQHIQKKGRGWYLDVPNNKWIKADQLNSYIDKRKRDLDQEAKDKAIRSRRYDLNY